MVRVPRKMKIDVVDAQVIYSALDYKKIHHYWLTANEESLFNRVSKLLKANGYM